MNRWDQEKLASFKQIRRDLHQMPEPGFAEYKTQRYLLDYLQQLPQDRLEIRLWRTGIVVKISGSGTGNKRKFGYRADMDGLPITEETGYEFRSLHEGYMHACGHDLHMTIGLGVVEYFTLHPIADDLIVFFQPAEEGPGGALPMLSAPELQDFMPEQMVALHVAPEYPVGTIATRPGILFANTSELFIDLTGTGGHAAYPHKANDMVVAACQLTGQLQTIVSRNVDPLDSAVVTIGKIEGGTKQNIIAEKARLEGTIRTLSAESMVKIKSRLEALVRGIEVGFECKAEIDYGSNYRQVYNEAGLTGEFMNWLEDREDVSLVECREAMTGEDFGYFLEKIPGFMFWLGVDTPYGLHHAKLAPDEEAIGVAIKVLADYFSWKSSDQVL